MTDAFRIWVEKYPVPDTRRKAGNKSLIRAKDAAPLTEKQVEKKFLEMTRNHYERYFGDVPRAGYHRVTAALAVKLYGESMEIENMLHVININNLRFWLHKQKFWLNQSRLCLKSFGKLLGQYLKEFFVLFGERLSSCQKDFGPGFPRVFERIP